MYTLWSGNITSVEVVRICYRFLKLNPIKVIRVNIDKSIPNNWAGALFGEDQSRIIFSFDPKNEKLIKESLSNVDWEKIGLVSKENIKFENIFFESDDLFLRYNKGFSTDI